MGDNPVSLFWLLICNYIKANAVYNRCAYILVNACYVVFIAVEPRYFGGVYVFNWIFRCCGRE